MNQNAEFLNYIYQNAQMGIEAIDQLVNIVEDPEFFKLLRTQLNEYEKIKDEASEKLNETGHEEKEVGKFAQISSYMMISIKTLTDRSSRHLAEMMLEGSNKGIIEITKHLSDYSDSDEDTKRLAEKLLKTEQSNVESLKKFL